LAVSQPLHFWATYARGSSLTDCFRRGCGGEKVARRKTSGSKPFFEMRA